MKVFNVNFFSDLENDGADVYSLGVFKTLKDAQNAMYEHYEETINLLKEEVADFTDSNEDEEYEDGEIRFYKGDIECAFTFFLDFYEWKITSWEI